MPALTLLNQKGGVGKTSSCYHTAGTLALAGRRILLVDADPQSSLTQGFLGPQQTRQLDPAETIVAVLAGDEPYPEQVIRPAGFDRIDLLPGSRHAALLNVPAPHTAPFQDQVRLRAFLNDVRDGYDLVLIDCPPNLHMASWAAMAASDGIVVPLQAEDFGAQGLLDVAESMAMVRAAVNPDLAMLGYVLSMFNTRRAVHKAYELRLRETYGPDVFTATVPEAVDFVEAIAQRKPVAMYKPRGAAAKSIKALADEMMARLAARSVQTERGAA